MGIKWSEAQQAVIDSRGCDLLVSAAAGSGKTAVLTERIVRALSDREHPADPEKMLVVTFTNAAAAQMRERIGARLDELIKDDPDSSLLRHQKLMLGAARISTIHSLCSELIQNNFAAVDIDPSYRMGDENELKILMADTVSDVLEVYYSSGNSAFRDFVSAYSSGRNDSRIAGWILKCYEMSRSCPSPEYWLDSCSRWYRCPEGGMQEHVITKYALAGAAGIFEKDKKLLKAASGICGRSGGPEAYLSQIEDAAGLIDDLAGKEDFDGIRESLDSVSFKALSRKSQKDVPEDLKDRVKSIYKQVRDDIAGLKKGLFSESLESMRGELEYIAPSVSMLTELVKAFSVKYQEEKQERNMLDFSDLEHYALKLLVEFYEDDEGELCWKPTLIADELSSYYQEVVCDEYQDSNRVQEMILAALSGSRAGRFNRLMVGDVKQSIYGFRQADAGIFLEKYKSYPGREHSRRIDLGQNFRSREYILEAVNSVFRRLMRSEVGGIEYDDDASLKPGTVFPDQGERIPSSVDVMLADSSAGEETDGEAAADAEETPAAMELEAAAVAQEIMRITDPAGGLDICAADGKSCRKAVYSDIAILLRSAKGNADIFANVLTARGIPAAAELSVGFFAAPEIMTMTALLNIVDNPRQDIPLAAVLRSPIVSMSSEEIAMVRASVPEGDLYTALCGCAPECPGYERAQTFLGMLGRLRRASDYMQIDELISYAFTLTGYYDIASAMPAGTRRKANLDMLAQKAAAFMAAGMSGLFNFMRYLEQMKVNQIDFGEARISEESGGHVSIVSIHKSKGLEYPVVILAGLARKMNRIDIYSSLAVHPKFGIGLDAANLHSRHRMKSRFRNFISGQLESEMMAEELRVLYVAMTRAKEKLILTGTVKDAAESLSRWQQTEMDDTGRMMPHNIVSAGSFLDLIMPCLFDAGALKDIEELYHLPKTGRRTGPEAGLFNVRTVSAQSILENDIVRTVKVKQDIRSFISDAKDTACGDGTGAQLDKDEAWEYKWEDDLHLKGKYSVSELKHQEAADQESEPVFPAAADEPEKVPLFMLGEAAGTAEKISGAARGTAFHRAMELIDIGNAPDTGKNEWVSEQLELMVSSGRLERFQADVVQPGRIAEFIGSELGQRMKAAAGYGKLRRESQFVMGVPAEMIDPGMKSDELILVQGVIDAWFEEDGKIILIDYKTDRVPRSGGGQILVSRYGRQLDYYSYALGRSTGRTVSEKDIYSVHLGEVIRLET